MKKRFVLILLLTVAVLTACKGKEKAETEQAVGQGETSKPVQANEADTQKPKVKITVKDYGTITVELDPQAAPITVENFLKLAKDGFYDGLTFHRIMEGFMIQGGDPLGTGIGGSDETIKGEFSSNGVENPISHTRGVISMARSQNKDSASSQFFIVHEDSKFLDGDYAAFGQVTEGMEIVDKISETVKPIDNNGSVKKEDQPIIERVEIIED